MNERDREQEEIEATAATNGDSATEADSAPADTSPLAPLAAEPDTHLHARTRPSQADAKRLQVVRRTHLGHERSRMEDACFALIAYDGGYDPLPPFGVFVVADGMGGHFDGHRASQLAARTVARHLVQHVYEPLLAGDAANRRPLREVMEEAVERANEALYSPDPDHETGTTLTAALLLGSRLFVGHVGDSRAYLWRGDEERLQRLTEDHTVVNALQNAGQLTPEEAATHPDRNLLYRALMGDPIEACDVFTLSLPDTGILLLCSDGLWGLVPDDELQATLALDIPLEEKGDRLVAAALDAGGHDNVCAVLVDFSL